MTDDADRQAVLDVLTSLVGEREDAELVLAELIAMPDKGPLLRALGLWQITIDHAVGNEPMGVALSKAWVKP